MFSFTVGAQNIERDEKDYRNFYGINWKGNVEDNLLYAKQMGYDFIFYTQNMEKSKNAQNMYFYIETPEYQVYPRTIDLDKTYTKEQQEYFSKFAALKNAELPFPDNIAQGWYFTPTMFSVEPDFQQQRVIDFVVDNILALVENIQKENENFLFAGFAWDVPQLTGDFWDGLQKDGGKQRILAHWRGIESGDIYPGLTHEYQTYSEGRAAYYKTLLKKTKEKYPEAKFIMEPYRIYENWIQHVSGREDVKELMPHILLQESSGLQFAADERIFESGLIDRSYIGSSTPNVFDEDKNRELAGTAAMNGSLFCWYGRFGGTGNMPDYKSISEVPARLQLVRIISQWENIHNTPLSDRKWENGIYSSPTAYISKDLIYAIQPHTGKIFVVFNTLEGRAFLKGYNPDMKIYRTNNMFIEQEETNADIEIINNEILLKNSAATGIGYIIK
jgi:hypothetical protein